MNKTQPGGRNRSFWKVFTRIVHRNAAHNDESEAPEQGFFVDFTYCNVKAFHLTIISGRKSFCFTKKEELCLFVCFFS